MAADLDIDLLDRARTYVHGSRQIVSSLAEAVDGGRYITDSAALCVLADVLYRACEALEGAYRPDSALTGKQTKGDACGISLS